jgi:hypothetical protein
MNKSKAERLVYKAGLSDRAANRPTSTLVRTKNGNCIRVLPPRIPKKE